MSTVRVPVGVHAEPGDDVPWPRCTARIDGLGLEHTDIGGDAAIVGLASKVEEALEDGSLNDCGPEQMLVVLCLHVANADRTLGRLLQRASMYYGQDSYNP